MTWLTLLLALGATARLTRLVTTDQFPPTIWLRAWVLGAGINRTLARWGKTTEPTKLTRQLAVDEARGWWPYKLLTCPWCLSIWIATPAVTVAYLQPHAWWFVLPAAALTLSHAAGLLARID